MKGTKDNRLLEQLNSRFLLTFAESVRITSTCSEKNYNHSQNARINRDLKRKVQEEKGHGRKENATMKRQMNRRHTGI